MKQPENTFILQKQWREQLSFFTNEEKGILLDAIYNYHCEGKDFESDNGMLNLMWATMKQAFEYNTKAYNEMCERNRKNIQKRWNKENTNQYGGIQPNTKNTHNDNHNHNHNHNDNHNKNDNKYEEIKYITVENFV